MRYESKKNSQKQTLCSNSVQPGSQQQWGLSENDGTEVVKRKMVKNLSNPEKLGKSTHCALEWCLCFALCFCFILRISASFLQTGLNNDPSPIMIITQLKLQHTTIDYYYIENFWNFTSKLLCMNLCDKLKFQKFSTTFFATVRTVALLCTELRFDKIL